MTRKSSKPPHEDPVKALRGMLGHVEVGSVELQHEAKRIRARKMNKMLLDQP